MKGSRRKSSALASIAQRRVSLALTAPNLQTLVRVYMLDGSSKVLQMMEKSTVSDVLKQLKFNLDLDDISTCALFRVRDGVGARRLELREVIKDVMKDVSDHDYTSGTTPKDTVKGIDGSASKSEVRILFRTWIAAKCGVFEKEIFQDHLKHKSPTSALYLAYMEANFMCFTGRYYLSEDEAIMLGCLKMQADSGDFDSDVHTVENVQHRVCTAFPRPISTRMKALLSPTISGGGNKADELAEKVQFLYARLAGKHKAEAQIEFLHTLRTWCPFYGATFFDVQCQYDDGDADEEPAVSTITVAIGPLAIFLITRHDNQLTILRHPYKRIVKWVAYSEKHIFNYWTIKQDVSLRDIEEAQQAAIAEAAREGKDYDVEEEFDATPYCDCIYLVTPNCAELEYLVRSYVALLKYDRYPCLAGATDELLSPDISEWYYIQGGKGNGVEEDENDDGSVREGVDEGGFDGDDSSVGGVDTAVRARRRGSASGRQGAKRRKSGRFKQLFSALGGYSTDSSSTSTSGKHSVTSTSSPRDDAIPSGERRNSASPSSWFGRMVTSGSGLGADSDDSDGDSRGSTRKKYGGDVSSVQSSVFQKIFKDSPGKGKDKDGGGKKPARRGSFSSTKSIDDDDEDVELPDQVKFAASMSHLQKLALERFSDSEDESETEDDDEDDDGGVKVTGSSFKHLDVGGPVQSVSGRRKAPPPPPPAVSPGGQGLPPPSGGVPGASPPSGGSPSLRRVSQILFGAGMSPSSTGTGHNDSDSSSSGSEGDSSSENEEDSADSD